jgi:hypothetical protein
MQAKFDEMFGVEEEVVEEVKVKKPRKKTATKKDERGKRKESFREKGCEGNEEGFCKKNSNQKVKGFREESIDEETSEEKNYYKEIKDMAVNDRHVFSMTMTILGWGYLNVTLICAAKSDLAVIINVDSTFASAYI